jgi:hypothetical protein
MAQAIGNLGRMMGCKVILTAIGVYSPPNGIMAVGILYKSSATLTDDGSSVIRVRQFKSIRAVLQPFNH